MLATVLAAMRRPRNAELAGAGTTRASGIVCSTASSCGLASERRTSPNRVNDRRDRSTAFGRVVLIFEERRVRRALRRLMSAIRREGCQLGLGGGPPRLLPNVGGQDEERSSIERSEGFGLVEDRPQLGELVAVSPELSRRGVDALSTQRGVGG
jgi:hypothetical protein